MTSDNKEDEGKRKGKIFSDAQRDYLKGKKVSENYASTLDSRIKRRAIRPLEDIRLFRKLDRSQREFIYNSTKKLNAEGKLVELGDKELWRPTKERFLNEGPIGLTFAFHAFFEFYYRTMRENGASAEAKMKELEYLIEKTEALVLKDTQGGRYDVNVTVEINDVSELHTEEAIEDAKRRFEEDGIHGVSSEELKALAEAGHITLKGNWE